MKADDKPVFMTADITAAMAECVNAHTRMRASQRIADNLRDELLHANKVSYDHAADYQRARHRLDVALGVEKE